MYVNLLKKVKSIKSHLHRNVAAPTGDTKDRSQGGSRKEGKGETSFRQRRRRGARAARLTCASRLVVLARGTIVVPLGWIIAMRCC